MSCRKVHAIAVPAAFPAGGSSHGPTCCVCSRPISHNPSGRDFGYEEAPYIRVIVVAVEDVQHRFRALDYRRSGQVCSESCAQVFAQFVGEMELSRISAGLPLCPAHGCLVIEWYEEKDHD